MRPSKLQHPLAVLRNMIGLGQKEMADLLGCSASTIQSIELRRLPISGKLAQRASEETSVSVGWLMCGDPAVPPMVDSGEEFTFEAYEVRRAMLMTRKGFKETFPFAHLAFGQWVKFKAYLFWLLCIGIRRGVPGVAMYKIQQALSLVEKSLGAKEGGLERAEGLDDLAEEVRRVQSDPYYVTDPLSTCKSPNYFSLKRGPYAKANQMADAFVERVASATGVELAWRGLSQGELRLPKSKPTAGARPPRTGKPKGKRARR